MSEGEANNSAGARTGLLPEVENKPQHLFEQIIRDNWIEKLPANID